MKKYLILLVFALSVRTLTAQDYMNKLLEKTCNCVSKINDSLEGDKYNMALGVCMLEAAEPYKKQLKKDYDIDMDRIDTQGEKMGRIIGVKMAAYCPDVLSKLTIKATKKKEEKAAEEMMMTGYITKVDKDFFVVFSLKDDTGKITKLYWLSFVESDIDLASDFSLMIGKNVEAYYKTESFYDPKIEEYRQFLVLTKLVALK
jgi:hypothetical protein